MKIDSNKFYLNFLLFIKIQLKINQYIIKFLNALVMAIIA